MTPGGLRGGVLQGIGHQVAQHLTKPGLVAQNLRGGAGPVEKNLHADAALRRDRLSVVHRVGGQGQQIHPMLLQRSMRVEPGQQQQVLDEQTHSARLTFDAVHQHLDITGGTLAVQLGEARIVVSGVRSSWLASVMKRRIRSSEVRACSADSSDDASHAGSAPAFR